MTDRERMLLECGHYRLQMDIDKQYKSLELTTDTRLREHMEFVIEACKFTQKKIIEMLGEEND